MSVTRSKHSTPRQAAAISAQAAKRRLAPRGKHGGRPPLSLARKISEHILATALEEFSSVGVDATSMESIARAAHVSKKTIYARFPSKEALLGAVLEYGISRQVTSIAMRPRGPNPRNALVALLVDMLEHSLSSPVIQVERLLLWARNYAPDLARAANDRATDMPIRLLAGFLDGWGGALSVAGCDNHQLATILFEACVIGPRRRAILGSGGNSSKARRAHIEVVVTLFLGHRSTPSATSTVARD